jgi:putative membrane protein
MDCALHAGSASGSTSILAAVAIASALLYARGWQRLHRRFPEIAAGCRPGAFYAGLVIAWAVIGSPLSLADHRLLTFHMLQHLILMTVAAPLLLWSGAGIVFLSALPRAVRPSTVRLLRSAAAVRIGRAIAHPVSCWIAGTGVVIAWHVPPAHELAMRSSTWHFLQQATFLAAGLLFWWPVMKPAQAKPLTAFAALYLFLATLPCDALSAFLAFCGRAIYPSHASAPVTLGLTPLADQQCAGALMWFWVTIAYLLPAVAITLRMLAPAAEGARAGIWSTCSNPRQGPGPVPGPVAGELPPGYASQQGNSTRRSPGMVRADQSVAIRRRSR